MGAIKKEITFLGFCGGYLFCKRAAQYLLNKTYSIRLAAAGTLWHLPATMHKLFSAFRRPPPTMVTCLFVWPLAHMDTLPPLAALLMWSYLFIHSHASTNIHIFGIRKFVHKWNASFASACPSQVKRLFKTN